MSETVTKLLATFELLTEKEQHELLIALLRRSGQLPDTSFSEDECVGITDQLFQTLDAAEQSNGNNATAG